MIDDLGPLQQLDNKIVSGTHHLFMPKPAYRMAQGGGWGSPNTRLVGENHPNGVLFNYFVKDYTDDMKVELKIEELDGTPIRSFSNKARERSERLTVKENNNRFVWDMRYPGFKEFDGMVLYTSPNRGPKAVPGKYRATLVVNETEITQEFEIVKDPRLPNTSADFKKQFDFLIAVRDKVSEAHQAIIDIRSIRDDINYFSKKLKEKEGYDEVLAMAKELDEKMAVIENNIHMTKNQSRQDPLNYGIRINNRLAFLLADQQRGDYPPTDQAEDFRKEVTEELDTEIKNLDELIRTSLSQINAKGREIGVQIISDRYEKVVKP